MPTPQKSDATFLPDSATYCLSSPSTKSRRFAGICLGRSSSRTIMDLVDADTALFVPRVLARLPSFLSTRHKAFPCDDGSVPDSFSSQTDACRGDDPEPLSGLLHQCGTDAAIADIDA